MSKIHEKLMKIQVMLNAPKNQHNDFGDYYYRSCEDILGAVKPFLESENCTLTISDNLELIGERYYIQATATLTDVETGESISNTAYAREPEQKPKMDSSQVTGSTSTYARKYALNGLFCIDDIKDADTNEFKMQSEHKYICTICHEEVKGYKKDDGTIISAKEAYQKCGNKCLTCWQKQKNNGGNQNV